MKERYHFYDGSNNPMKKALHFYNIDMYMVVKIDEKYLYSLRLCVRYVDDVYINF